MLVFHQILGKTAVARDIIATQFEIEFWNADS